MASEIDDEVNVLLRVRQHGGRVKEIVELIVELFSGGGSRIVGLAEDAGHLVVELQVDAASWAAAVSYTESRLDRLSFDWRQHASCGSS